MSDHIPIDCKNPQYYVARDGEYKRRPCASRRCHDPRCRQAWARKEACVMLRSFASLPPTHFIVLRCNSLTTPAEYRPALRRFLRTLRGRLDFEYRWWIEPGIAGPHIHLLVRAERFPRRLAKRLWRLACGAKTRIYCQPVRCAAAVARYVPKFARGLRVPAVPASWDRPLAGNSRGFWAKPKQTLWREVKGDWFKRAA